MPDGHDTLRYHGRRSVDELVGAMKAQNRAAALVHKQLSLMHLDRFVAMMTFAADGVGSDRSAPRSPVQDEPAR